MNPARNTALTIESQSMRRTLVFLALLLSCIASRRTAARQIEADQQVPERRVVALGGTNRPNQPVIRVEAVLPEGQVSFLGWDTESLYEKSI